MATRSWSFPLALDPRAALPQYLQIARGVVSAIRSGRLAPGQPLPGSRTLATSLGVHRNTVLAAYDELMAEGWITTSRATGTFVSRDLPVARIESAARHPALAPSTLDAAAIARRCGFPVEPALPFDPPPTVPPGAFLLSKGAPDVRLLPVAELTRAYRRALRREGPRLLGYGDPRGLPQLRSAFAAMLRSARGLDLSRDDLMVTRGSQMAIDLAARSLIAPGDTVAIEALGHPAIWTALRLAGARLVPIPVDRQGLDTEALTDLLAREPVRAVYVTPHHQFPTTSVMPAARRLRLLELARRYGTAIIEDDYDHEFHYDGPTIPPLASLDQHDTVIYIGTLSKILAPGLRIGFVTAPRPVLERMTGLRVASDLQGDQLTEWMVADCFASGELGRHVRRMRRVYRLRRDALASALTAELGPVLSFEVPTGGMALWATVSADVDLAGWVERSVAAGVIIRSGSFYDATGTASQALRLGFTCHQPAELVEAVRRMKGALVSSAHSGPSEARAVGPRPHVIARSEHSERRSNLLQQ
jgi:GntR family transcriptional regulator/MocR family aminotransferase